jgi:hypothetical protein
MMEVGKQYTPSHGKVREVYKCTFLTAEGTAVLERVDGDPFSRFIAKHSGVWWEESVPKKKRWMIASRDDYSKGKRTYWGNCYDSLPDAEAALENYPKLDRQNSRIVEVEF